MKEGTPKEPVLQKFRKKIYDEETQPQVRVLNVSILPVEGESEGYDPYNSVPSVPEKQIDE